MEGVTDHLRATFPLLDRDECLIAALAQGGEPARFPAGAALFRRGAACGSIGFFLEGSVRVFSSGGSGRQITLYEILPGEICILNAACVLARRGYPAEAATLEPTECLLVPADAFRRLFAEREALRDYVFGLFADRLALMMELIGEVTFGCLERRLDDYLIERAENDRVALTHQAIANDLGSSREVVSRLLKEFERRGRVRLGRSEILLLDPGGPADVTGD
jgi:CRP/FNR family transcriptional regulator